MPGFDRTGPLGAGPMTGGGFGLCGGRAAVGRGAGPGLARGFRGGFGGGVRHRARGWGYGPMDWGPSGPMDERSILEAQVAGLRSELEVLQRRLSELTPRAEDRPQT